MSQSIISLKKVAYRYPHSAEGRPAALRCIDLDVAPGEFVAVVGGNGSGKSTLAKLLNGLILPESGTVEVDGLLTAESRNIDRIRETVGMVFQNPESQIVATTVEDDIAFGMENVGLPADEIERRLAEAAERFGLTSLLDREPHRLSGGQKQRTVLAGVYALRPRVLVLDEPTSMLDPASQQEFINLINDMWSAGTTVIHITQMLEEIVAAPRAVALAGGRIVFDGAPRDLFADDALLAKASLTPPFAARLALSLVAEADGGVKVPALPLSLEELVSSLC